MGDPVVCTLVLVRDISLSLSLWPFIWGQLRYLLQTGNAWTLSIERAHAVNIFNGSPAIALSGRCLSVADPS